MVSYPLSCQERILFGRKKEANTFRKKTANMGAGKKEEEAGRRMIFSYG
jgi:hypothetical protein